MSTLQGSIDITITYKDDSTEEKTISAAEFGLEDGGEGSDFPIWSRFSAFLDGYTINVDATSRSHHVHEIRIGIDVDVDDGDGDGDGDGDSIKTVEWTDYDLRVDINLDDEFD